MALRPVDYALQFLAGFGQTYVAQKNEQRKIQQEQERADEQYRKQLRTQILAGQYGGGNVGARAELERLTGHPLPEPLQPYRKEGEMITIGVDDPILAISKSYTPGMELSVGEYNRALSIAQRNEASRRAANRASLYYGAEKDNIQTQINALRVQSQLVDNAMRQNDDGYGGYYDTKKQGEYISRMDEIYEEMNALNELLKTKTGSQPQAKQKQVDNPTNIPGVTRVQ